MLFTIEGFSQQALLDHGLDPIDAVILRWIMNFWGSGHMRTYRIKRREYFWLKYEYVLQEIPIIRIKTPIALRRRFVKYVKEGIMASETIRGNVTCYRFTKKFYTLMSKPSQKIEQEEWLIQGKSQGVAKPKSLRDTSGLPQEIEQSKQPKQGKSQGGPKPKSLGGKPKSLALYNKDNSKINNSKITTTTKEDLPRLDQENAVVVVVENPHQKKSYLNIQTLPSEIPVNGGKLDPATFADRLSEIALHYNVNAVALEQFVYHQEIAKNENGLQELETVLQYSQSHKRQNASLLGFAKNLVFHGKATVNPEQIQQAQTSWSPEARARLQEVLSNGGMHS